MILRVCILYKDAKGILHLHLHQKDAHDEAHSLAITDLRIMEIVAFQYLAEHFLALAIGVHE